MERQDWVMNQGCHSTEGIQASVRWLSIKEIIEAIPAAEAWIA